MGLLAWIRNRRRRGRAATDTVELPADDPPIDASIPWSGALAGAERLSARGDAEAAAEALQREVARLRGVAENTRALLATTLAHLGRAHAARGMLRDGIAATREALELWRASGDREGVISALANLVELEKRSGASEAAGAHARELASEYAQGGDDAHVLEYGKLARELTAGSRDRKAR
jgi:tetratricopeptide (TPR) repeat protein